AAVILAASLSSAADGEPAMQLISSAFSDGDALPARHTCEGRDVSPPLAWREAPEGTRSFAMIVDDPDAPDPAAPKMTYVHWVMYDIPPSIDGLDEGATATSVGGREGTNDWNRTGYGGPCPPIGRHRYFFKLYALDTLLGDLGAPNKADLERAMEGHIVARAELMGTYERPAKARGR